MAAGAPPTGVDAALARLDPWVAAPARAGLFTDFDGTLAPIVLDPSTSRPLPGVVEALDGLALRLAQVAVVSGRGVDVLAALFPGHTTLSGLYGLQRRVDGRRDDHPEARTWAPVVADAVAHAERSAPSGTRVEPKGLSLTLHYRGRPDLAEAVEAWAAGEAARTGLVAHPARMSVELHPPIEADKGSAVLELAEGLEAVAFIGDDVGDLPAFAALDGLAARGVAVAKLAVASTEQDPRVRAAADVELAGPDEVLAVLLGLLARLSPPR